MTLRSTDMGRHPPPAFRFPHSALSEVRHAEFWCQSLRRAGQRRANSPVAGDASFPPAPVRRLAVGGSTTRPAVRTGRLWQDRPALRVAAAQAAFRQAGLAQPGRQTAQPGETGRSAGRGAGRRAPCAGNAAGVPRRLPRARAAGAGRPARRIARRPQRLDRAPAGAVVLAGATAGQLPPASRLEPAAADAAQ
ncbi:hypothetical protein D9M71_571140 [compost metagenome]